MSITKAEASTPSVSGYPSLSRARVAQIILIAIAFFTQMDIYVVGLMIEPIKTELHLSDVQIGLANTTAFYGVYGVLAIPMGMLVDRRNRVRLLSVAILCWCSGLAIVGLADGLPMLIAGKGVLGLANAITYPAAMSLLADYFAPERRAVATSTYAVGQILGGAGATLIGGLGFSALARLAATHPGALGPLTPWRAVFLAFAGVGMITFPALLGIGEPARQERGARAGTSGGFSELWQYRRILLATFLGIMFLTGVSTGVSAWAAPALMRLYHQKPGDFAGWYSLTALIAGGLAVLASGKLVERERRNGGRGAIMRPAAFAALVMAPASFLAVVPNVACFAVASTIFIFCSSIGIAVPVIALNFRIPNELRGLTMGAYLVLFALSGAIAAPLVAAVGRWLGGDMMIGWAMASTGAPFAILAAAFFWAASRAEPGTAREDVLRMPA